MGRTKKSSVDSQGMYGRVWEVHIVCLRVGRQGQEQVANPGSEHRMVRDFVALAVASQDDVVAEEQTTGVGGDREQNMVEFARLGLELLKRVMVEEGDSSKIGKI
ncbi:MAG: hypothetical protein LQ352_005779 [Teloschistes flavicans]|nr:MAG: hypothetical protein LQ352_005779 [Teloschistes flavicans]